MKHEIRQEKYFHNYYPPPLPSHFHTCKMANVTVHINVSGLKRISEALIDIASFHPSRAFSNAKNV